MSFMSRYAKKEGFVSIIPFCIFEECTGEVIHDRN